MQARMSVGPPGDSMDTLARHAGAGTVVQEYLAARGVASVGAMSMLAKDDDAFELAIIRPLLDGFGTPTGKLEVTAAEQPIARAVLLYMFHLAKEARSTAAITASASPTLPPASPGASGSTAKAATSDRKGTFKEELH